jgi:hypothetical protein
MAIIVMLVAGYKGVFKVNWDSKTRLYHGRIYDISVEAEAQDSVIKLLVIRDEIRANVRKKWREKGNIDRAQGKELQAIIAERIREAQFNLKNAFMAQIRVLKSSGIDGETDPRFSYSSIEKYLWHSLEKGELESSQHSYLLKLLRDTQTT